MTQPLFENLTTSTMLAVCVGGHRERCWSHAG
jgi:hypothetical protein